MIRESLTNKKDEEQIIDILYSNLIIDNIIMKLIQETFQKLEFSGFTLKVVY